MILEDCYLCNKPLIEINGSFHIFHCDICKLEISNFNPGKGFKEKDLIEFKFKINGSVIQVFYNYYYIEKRRKFICFIYNKDNDDLIEFNYLDKDTVEGEEEYNRIMKLYFSEFLKFLKTNRLEIIENQIFI